MKLFTQLGNTYPQLANLSAQRFSKLTRAELFNISRVIKKDYPMIYSDYLYRYPNLSDSVLAKQLYKCVNFIFA